MLIEKFEIIVIIDERMEESTNSMKTTNFLHTKKRDGIIQPNKPELIEKSHNNQRHSNNAKIRENWPKRNTIIVQMKDKTCSDLLKIVKSALNPSLVSVELENMKSTEKRLSSNE